MIPVRKIGPLLECLLLPLLLIHVELFWHLTPAPATTHLLLLALLVPTIVVLGDLFGLTRFLVPLHVLRAVTFAPLFGIVGLPLSG